MTWDECWTAAGRLAKAGQLTLARCIVAELTDSEGDMWRAVAMAQRDESLTAWNAGVGYRPAPFEEDTLLTCQFRSWLRATAPLGGIDLDDQVFSGLEEPWAIAFSDGELRVYECSDEPRPDLTTLSAIHALLKRVGWQWTPPTQVQEDQ